MRKRDEERERWRRREKEREKGNIKEDKGRGRERKHVTKWGNGEKHKVKISKICHRTQPFTAKYWQKYVKVGKVTKDR